MFVCLFIYLLTPAMFGQNSKIDKHEFTLGGSTGQTLHLGPKPSEEPEDWIHLELWRPKSAVSEIFYSCISKL